MSQNKTKQKGGGGGGGGGQTHLVESEKVSSSEHLVGLQDNTEVRRAVSKCSISTTQRLVLAKGAKRNKWVTTWLHFFESIVRVHGTDTPHLPVICRPKRPPSKAPTPSGRKEERERDIELQTFMNRNKSLHGQSGREVDVHSRHHGNLMVDNAPERS
jgi:hypothetical protein